MVVNSGEQIVTQQIFVVGMNGSGTTMLLDHLSSHSMIYGFPAETKSLPYFIEHQAEYGDLAIDDNFLRLWNDMRSSVAERTSLIPVDLPVPGPGSRSAAGAFDHIMRTLATAEGRRIWCEKTPMHVHHIAALARTYPAAKFIHVIRDGRDCAASFHRRWRFSPLRTIYRWKQAVRAGMQQGAEISPRYLEVRYEAVTRDPESALRDVCRFLGMEFEQALLSAARKRPDSEASREGQVIRNSRRAEEYFDPSTVAKMEKIAGRLLAELGYPCRNPVGDDDPVSWKVTMWRLGDDWRRFAAVATRRGRILRPSKWRYILGRTRNALKQRATSKT
jgi:hypothetical protein